ncbi:MAG: AAA family ATPase, partial [Nitrososphaeria archaeon]
LSFEDLNYDLPEGVAYIVGPNGSGKTNLFRLINYVLVALNPHKRVDSLINKLK